MLLLVLVASVGASACAPRLAPTPAVADPDPPAGWQHGRVLDDRGVPLRGASVWAGSLETVTDRAGVFALGPLEAGASLVVTMPGYRRARVVPEGVPLTVRLAPQVVRALYLSYYGVGDPRIRRRVLDLVERTEVNGLVIDVKGDRGWIPYRTAVPVAIEAGARGPVLVDDFEGFLAGLAARGIYTIARIVAFKDTVLAHHRPEWAVIDAKTGQPWLDNEGLAWIDPFREEAWDYLIAVAREAAAKGFDEVQLDYLRFPSEGRLGAARYARPSTRANRLDAITGFLARMRRELGSTGVYLAAAVFGYTAFNEDDTNIGQRVEELAGHVDYLNPMVYPSGYHLGIPGVRNPVEHPYEVVRETIRLVVERSAHTTARVRPWLQDFRDYAFDRRAFGPREIAAQMRGAADAGALGWMLWNPRNEYTAEALGPGPGPGRPPER